MTEAAKPGQARQSGARVERCGGHEFQVLGLSERSPLFDSRQAAEGWLKIKLGKLPAAKRPQRRCWAQGSRDEIRAIVTRAFNTDKAGQINRSEIFMLLRLDISDPRWLRAMKAIRDAMRVEGSKTYVRCYRRPTVESGWQAVSIDLAKA